MGSKGWRSGESARLPPKRPGFISRRRHHMWVEFVVGSLLRSERFFSGYSGFPLSSKTSISKFQFDQESGRRRTTLWMCYLHIVIYLFINYNQVGCVNKLYDVNAWQPLKATSQQTAVSRFSLVFQLLTTKHKLIFKISRTLQAKCSKRYTDLQS